MTEATSPAGGRPFPTHTVVIPDDVEMVSLLGPRDEMLRTIERAFPRLVVHARGNEVYLTGPQEEIQVVEQLIDELLEILGTGQSLNRDAVERSIHMLRDRTRERPAEVLTQNIVSSRGRTIRPKTLGQKQYVDAIDTNTVVFGIGPAGTGKTYLAMAKAVAALQAKQVNRILLTRPAVEAGERLGFLPGTLTDKIDPYLRPLYDALHDMLDPESIPRLMAAGTIEVAPLAYMRGRAQPVDSQVLTPTGWRRFGDQQVGDLVIGSDGRPTPVIGVYPQGRRQVFRVAAADGASTLACAEHLWTVRIDADEQHAHEQDADQQDADEQLGRWRTLRTEEMTGSLGGDADRFELPLVQAVELIEREVPMDPYVLGRLLVKGHRSASTVPALAGAGARGGLATAASEADVLSGLGLAGTTASTAFVPDVYKINAPWVRRSLLRGLLDLQREGEAHQPGGDANQSGGDAHQPGCDGNKPADGMRFRTGSARLRDDVTFLVRSLGGIVFRCDEEARDAYILDIRLPETGPRRYLQSIEPAGEAETMCIQVAAADSLYVTEDFLLTHNTLNDAFIILDEAQNTSPEQMKMFLTRLGFGSKMVVTGDVTQVDLPGGVQSGLRVVREILEGLEDVHFSELTAQDVVRHRLVGAIVDAYGQWDARQSHTSPDRRPADRRPGRRHERRREGMDPA